MKDTEKEILDLTQIKFADPEFVYTTYNDELGLTPIPDTSNRTLKFDYYVTNTDLSAHGDTGINPDKV